MQNTNRFLIIFSGLIICFTNIWSAASPSHPLPEIAAEALGEDALIHHPPYTCHKIPKACYLLLLPAGKGLTIDNYKGEVGKLMTKTAKGVWMVGSKKYLKASHARQTAATVLGIKYGCLECDATFTRADAVARHMYRTDKHKASRDYKCFYCDRKFFRIDHVQEHQRRWHSESVSLVQGDGLENATADLHYQEGSGSKKPRTEAEDASESVSLHSLPLEPISVNDFPGIDQATLEELLGL